jgi:hypothetical protein
MKILKKIIDDLAVSLLSNREVQKVSKKAVETATSNLKKDGRSVFIGNFFVITKKTTPYKLFDKDAFVAHFGQAEYDKWTKDSVREEFIITRK